MNKPVAWMCKSGFEYQQVKEDFSYKEKEGWIPLYTHPVKELHLSLQKSQDGELLAVTYTDDEHRIVEVLWERPPVKELTDEEIMQLSYMTSDNDPIDFALAILRKAQEK